MPTVHSDNFIYDGRPKTAEYTGSTTQGSGTEIATWSQEHLDTREKGLLSFAVRGQPASDIRSPAILGLRLFGNPTGGWFNAVPP